MRTNDFQFNRMQLLKAVRRAEPVARTDLQKITGLAAGTITQLTADLIRRQVLVEAKSEKKSFGRPRIELKINAKASHAVSVFSRGDGQHTVEIVDLRGDVTFRREFRLGHSGTLVKRAAQLARGIETTLKAATVKRADIACIGILIHGIVDNQKGIVHWLATYPDREVPLAAIIEKRLSIPVFIDNDTNLLARAEHWFGEAGDLDDFSVLLIDLGMGAAHYVDGMLWSGAHGVTPALGHVKIVTTAPRPCYCGAEGCLVAHCSMWSIVSQICEQRGEELSLSRIAEHFATFAALARAGDKEVRRVFQQTGTILGTVAANLLHERNPTRLVVMAFSPELLPLISEAFHAALKASALPEFAAKTDVQLKVIENAAYYRKGCAALALEQIYQSNADFHRSVRKRKARARQTSSAKHSRS